MIKNKAEQTKTEQKQSSNQGKKQAAEKVNKNQPAKKKPVAKKKKKTNVPNKAANDVLQSNQHLFAIDNTDLPEGIPPTQPILSEWVGSAPTIADLQSTKKQASSKRKKNTSANNQQVKSTESIQQEVLTMLQNNGHAMDAESLYEALQSTEESVREALQQMFQRKDIFLSKKHRIALPEQLGYVTGRLQTTSKGFGFLLPDDGSQDIYISQQQRNDAMNGDRVVVRTMASKNANHSREGVIVGIQEHANAQVIGILQKDTKGYYIQPDNPRLDTIYRLSKSGLGEAKVGQKVVAGIQYNDDAKIVKIEELLGFPDEAGVDVLSIIKDHGISTEFSDDVLKEVATIPQEVLPDDLMWREDCRKLVCVTIDGADSKDFDDAVSCEQLSNGHYLLGVHIADVAHYVREGMALDKEAYERGTSVYFIDRVVPMLPEALSNGICSLNPRVDRLALSCFMEIDATGEIVAYRISETVIRSKSRLVYNDVTALLKGGKTQRKRYKTLVPMLEMMEKLSEMLEKRRNERGSIDFDIPEARIVVDEHGKPQKIELNDRGISNKMIESFMLACNETIARHMAQLHAPMAYRVHEVPDQEKMEDLRLFLSPYGITLRTDQGSVEPKALQQIMQKISGTPEEASVSRMLLRSLKKARYYQENLGHFGLAASYYAHFTSPIRRYPDLIVHRILKEMMHGHLNEKRMTQWHERLPEMMNHCSIRERVAMEAERDVDDLKKCEYMANYLGQEFEGKVSGVTNFGLFVELANTCEGLIRMANLQDDYYVFDEAKHCITGQRSGRRYQLGDPIRIRVDQADITSRRVDFSLVLTEQQKQNVAKRKQKDAKKKQLKSTEPMKENAKEKTNEVATKKNNKPKKNEAKPAELVEQKPIEKQNKPVKPKATKKKQTNTVEKNNSTENSANKEVKPFQSDSKSVTKRNIPSTETKPKKAQMQPKKTKQENAEKAVPSKQKNKKQPAKVENNDPVAATREAVARSAKLRSSSGVHKITSAGAQMAKRTKK